MEKRLRKGILCFAFVAATISFFPTQASANLVTFDLFGRGFNQGGFGQTGLFLGPWFNSTWSLALDPKYNFNFTDVQFTINTQTGNVTIGGDITHQQNNQSWNLNISLTGFHFFQLGSQFFQNSQPYAQMIEDLLAVPQGWFAGFYWDELDLVISPNVLNPDYDGPLEWTGWSMNHPGTAEFYTDRFSDDIFYDAWYQPADGSTYTGFYNGRFYQNVRYLGDTKSTAENPRSPEIPEPGTLALFGLSSLVGLFFKRFRR